MNDKPKATTTAVWLVKCSRKENIMADELDLDEVVEQ